VQLPNLNVMGASALQKDLFMELNAMWTGPQTTYGLDGPLEKTDPDGHSHMLSPPNIAALGLMYASRGITPHFDVGDPQTYRDRYVVECQKTKTAVQCEAEKDDADDYLVDGSLASGGEIIQEKACSDPNPAKCQFGKWPGTVGWPLGAQLLRDAPVADNGGEIAVSNDDGTPHADLVNWANGASQRRRFDLERRDYFRYVLYGHARGKARSSDPCLDAEGNPTDYVFVAGKATCAGTHNPEFHTPKSLSGIAHLPGRDALVTLGLWDDFTGSEFVQGSTTAHELGHTMFLWHGGEPALFGDRAANPPTATFIPPNCKPNYLSSMSYSFQAIGLLDDNGNPYFDYSAEKHDPIDENGLSDVPLTPGTNDYRPAWFVQLVPLKNPGGPGLPPVSFNPLAANQGAPPATRFCSGQKFNPASPPFPRARVEADLIASSVDWDGAVAEIPADQLADPNVTLVADVNFDGATTVLKGFNDWENLRLDQIGGARDFTLVRSLTASGGTELIVDAGSGGELMLEAGGGGELAIDLGSGIELRERPVEAGGGGELMAELGGGGELVLEAGGGGELMLEVGGGGELLAELGGGGELMLELGGGTAGGGELVLELGGGGELVLEAGGGGDSELTYEAALALGRAAPQRLTACVIGTTNCQPAAPPDYPKHRTYLTWQPPTFGTVAFYRVYRRPVGGTLYEEISGPTGTTDTFFVDHEELPEGQQFAYVVRAQFDDAVIGRSSNVATITARNEAPLASADLDASVGNYVTFVGNPLTVDAASGLLSNDIESDDSPSGSMAVVTGTFTTTGGGSVTIQANGSFTYYPRTVPEPFIGEDTFTYQATDGRWSRRAGSPYSDTTDLNLSAPVMVTITVTALEGCVTGTEGCEAPVGSPLHRTYLTWPPPPFQVSLYEVYRRRPGAAFQKIGQTLNVVTDFTDGEELPNNVQFEYQVRAVTGEGPLESNIVSITAVNDPPVANNDPVAAVIYATLAGDQLTVAATPSGLLTNDTDSDTPLNRLKAVAVTSLATTKGGAVTISDTGGFVYTPPAGFAGVDTFTYQANNGLWTDALTPMSANSAATVTVQVVPKLTACVSGAEGCFAGEVQNHRTYLAWSPAAEGAVQYRVSRKVGASAFGEIGTSVVAHFIDEEELPNDVTFHYEIRVEYAGGALSPASNTASIVAVNDRPVANFDTYETNQGTVLEIAAPGVLSNDTDFDSPNTPLRVAVPGTFTNGGGGGVLELNADGGFKYTPPSSEFVGTDSFTYRVPAGTWGATGIPMSADSFDTKIAITVKAPPPPPE
jgi:hypothetical protein